jgi:predicted transcriptional regulator
LVDELSSFHPIKLATELTIAWLSNPNTRASLDEVPDFLSRIHEAVVSLGSENIGESAADRQNYVPATTVRRSLASNEHLISLIDGKPYKTLRRHLSGHGLTPDQYRERYNLKADYPMVAPSYSEVRRAMAKKIGLGQKGRAAKKPGHVASPVDAPVRRGRNRRVAKPA